MFEAVEMVFYAVCCAVRMWFCITIEARDVRFTALKAVNAILAMPVTENAARLSSLWTVWKLSRVSRKEDGCQDG